jgi:hypothetical protein
MQARGDLDGEALGADLDEADDERHDAQPGSVSGHEG